MKRIVCIVLILTLSIGLFSSCGTSDNKKGSMDKDGSSESGEVVTVEVEKTSKELIIGSWKMDTSVNYRYHEMTLFVGGTGKAYSPKLEKGAFYPLTWEDSDGIINIYCEGMTTVGYKVSENEIDSVDGEYHWVRTD